MNELDDTVLRNIFHPRYLNFLTSSQLEPVSKSFLFYSHSFQASLKCVNLFENEIRYLMKKDVYRLAILSKVSNFCFGVRKLVCVNYWNPSCMKYFELFGNLSFQNFTHLTHLALGTFILDKASLDKLSELQNLNFLKLQFPMIHDNILDGNIDHKFLELKGLEIKFWSTFDISSICHVLNIWKHWT